MPCCRDTNAAFPFGNVFEKGVHAVFNGEEATAFSAGEFSTSRARSRSASCAPAMACRNCGATKPAGFTIERHSVNTSEIPTHDQAIADSQNTILSRPGTAA